MIKVAWHRSLGGKLFLLVGACLAGTVMIISWQNGQMFSRFLDRQIEDHTLDETRDAAAGVAAVLENWRGQTAMVVHALVDEPSPERRRNLMQKFVDSNREIVGLGLYDKSGTNLFAFTPDRTDVRFEDKTARAVENRVKQQSRSKGLALAKRKAPARFGLDSWSKRIGLPVLALTMVFGDTQGNAWVAVLSVWQGRVSAALPSGFGVRSAVFDTGARRGSSLVDVSTAKERQVAAAEQGLLLDFAKAQGSPFGFRSFTDRAGAPRTGAFVRLPKSGGLSNLVVMASRDARPGYTAVQRIVFQTAIWTWVILLGAIFVSFVAVAGITKRLKSATQAALRIAAGDFSAKLTQTSRDEVGVLSLAVNHMSDRIVDLLKSKVLAARQEKELETAKAVQDLLYPKGEIGGEGISIVGHCEVASECGGDWWGHFLTQDGRHFVMIVDVTGHGAPAAIVTAMAFSARTLLAEQYSDPKVHQGSVLGVLAGFNRLLYEAGRGAVTATALLFMIDPVTGEMAYVNAGHTMPALIPADPKDVRLKGGGNKPHASGTRKQRQFFVRCNGMLLGYQPELSPLTKEHRGVLEPGDKLVMYTDGLIECANAQGKAWTKVELSRHLSEHAEGSAKDLKASLLSAAHRHYGSNPLEDDVTLVIVERHQQVVSELQQDSPLSA